MRYLCLFLVSFVVIGLLSCNSNVLRVTKFTPAGEVDNFQSFSITFNKNIAPQDKMNSWHTADYLHFEPQINGQYKWVSPNTLVFSPKEPLKAGQQYTTSFNKTNLLEKSPTPNMDARFTSISFKTPDFKVEKVSFFTDPIANSNYQMAIKSNIKFNYKVKPEEFKKYVQFFIGEKEIKNYTLMNESASDEIALQAESISQTDKEQTLRLVIKKGLNSILEKDALAEDKTFTSTLPPLQRVEITDAFATMDENGYVITLGTTQIIDEKKLTDFLEITPKLSYPEITLDDNKVQIRGKGVMPNEVKVKVKKGLPGLYGGVLEEDYANYVTAADVEPLLRFSDQKGMYLLKGGEENIKIEVVNLPQVQVIVEEVFQNNVLFFFNNNYSYEKYRYSYSDDEFLSQGNEFSAADYGKEIYSEKMTFNGPKNMIQSATINLHNVLNQRFKGIYIVSVISEDDYYIRDSKIISFSDIGMIAKYSGEDLWVFANSLKTTEGMPNTEVSLISSNNQVLAKAVTDATGLAKFEKINQQVKGFSPRLVYASAGDDFNFIDMEATEVGTSRFDVGGKLVENGFYDTYIYSDRNIYRPGESAHLSAIVRDNLFGVVKDLPVQLKVISPTGKIFAQMPFITNEQGSFETPVEIPDFAQTGQYVAEVYTGDSRLMNSYRFHVEEFQPDKIRVQVETPEEAKVGEEINVDIFAEYLYGEKAAGQKYETDIVLKHLPFQSKKYSGFAFSNHTFQNTSTENQSASGVLDAGGKASEPFSVPEELSSGGIVEGNAYVSVFDATGRTVNRVSRFHVYPKDYFVGIKKKGYYFGTNQNITFQAVAVSPQDKPLDKFEAEYTLVKYEWQTVLKKSDDKFAYQSEEKESEILTKTVRLDGGEHDITFQVPASGRYRLKIARKGDTNGYVYQDFYAYNYNTTTASSFEINKEGQIDIVLDKASYTAGETAKALFITPFTGKMLVTIEREKIFKHFYVDVKQNSVEIPIPLEDIYLPNVYISATLFKPHHVDNQQIPLFVGHGFKSITLEKPQTKLPVTLIAPERIRPRTKQTVTVKTVAEKDIFVTLAAVDEGILQVKNFKTPDPHAYMYEKRRLSIESYDLYQLLLPEYKKMSSSAAGGDDYQSGKYQNPIKSKRFKLVSLWSGIRKTDSNGEVKIEVDIPQFNGEIRLMAVCYKGATFGAGEKPMKVTDDVILMPAIPRTLTLGDSLSLPVNVVNMTNKAGKVSVNMEIEGPLKITSQKMQSVELEANKSGFVYFGVQTTDDVGLAKINIRTTGVGITQDETEIAVRPASTFVTESGSGEIKAGETLTIQVPADYVVGTQSSRLAVSTFPALQHANNLRQLIGYPHGCLEQVTSKLFPQLYFPELAKLVAPDMIGKGEAANYYVKQGIHKIESMMNYDGNFRYWQNGDIYNSWASVYATHFLVEAQKAGYEVDPQQLRRALKSLLASANEKKEEDYVTYTATGKTIKKIAPKSGIYALYVLSKAGQADISLMNYYRARPELLTSDTRYLLAGAFALAKNWQAYNELLPKTFEPERTENNSENFDSDIRANALILNVLLDVDPTNAKIPIITNFLAAKKADSYSTQENAWMFLALGKAAGKQADSKVEVTVTQGGKTLKKFDTPNGSFHSEAMNGKTLTLTATGTGSTYYFWSTEGTKKYATVKEEDKEMQVRRTYYDRKGTALQANEFKQGDLIVCKVTITGGERSLKHLAITDLAPSGFEIENPRLTPSTQPQWVEKAGGSFSPEYLDVRDDRIVLFTHLAAKETQTYYYLMRVVNTGRFELPALAGESMYDKQIHSYHGARKVSVRNG